MTTQPRTRFNLSAPISPRGIRRPHILGTMIALPLLLVALTLATPASADDSASVPPAAPTASLNRADAEALVKGLRLHLRQKDGDAIKADLERIAGAYAHVEHKAARTHMRDAVGKTLRFRNEDIQSAALDAFADMNDPAAWKHYRSLLGKPFKKNFPRLSSEAMDLTRNLTPDGAVLPLITILKKSKNLAAAAKALHTLGAYGESRQRSRILGEIIAVTLKEKPGMRGRDNTVVYGPRASGEGTRNRWQALSHRMVTAANELTGQDLSSPDDWFQAWRSNKREPDELFDLD